MLNIYFELEGEKQMIRQLRGVSTKMKNWRPEFVKTGRLLLKTFRDNFATQGRTLGEPWARLKPATIKQKMRLGYLAQGPLVRTGKMKEAFISRPGSDHVTITNPTPYFAYHQSNRPRRKLPRRVMMKIDQRRKQEIVKIFQSSVQELLKERSNVAV